MKDTVIPVCSSCMKLMITVRRAGIYMQHRRRDIPSPMFLKTYENDFSIVDKKCEILLERLSIYKNDFKEYNSNRSENDVI